MEFFPSTLVKRSSQPVANPSAGADWSQTVGASGEGLEGEGWLLKAVSGQIVQGATQVPQPILQLTDPAGNVLFESFGSSNAMTAVTTARFTWAPMLALSALVGTTPAIHAVAPLPEECFLPPGFVIKSVTLGIGANTQWTGVTLWLVQAG